MTDRISQLLFSIAERSALATISQAGPDSDALRRYLRDQLVQPPGSAGSFLADPVIEAGFDWHRANRTMQELAGDVLHRELVDAIDRADAVDANGRKPYRFERGWAPYGHQLSAWQALTQEPARSVLVTSGTGSGKTECFLIPILDGLVRERETGVELTGVRAIMLYPLNALINSQRDRLTDWTSPFKGDLRFCLYNGETKEAVSAAEQRAEPWRVLSRKDLRASPPPILVTNVTMLEYMLVRSIDAPILRRSKGLLRWIVLDEAHSYIGSQAAELSLLIRRVLRAFGVSSQDVRFVATSATIGEGEETRAKLASFMADVAGVPRERVSVIEGRRDVTDLPDREDLPLPRDDEPVLADPVQAGRRIAANRNFRKLRHRLAQRPLTLAQAAECIFGYGGSRDPQLRAQTLDLVDVAARSTFEGRRLLPLRLHLFHRAQPGLWACIDASCPGRIGAALDTVDWHYGRVVAQEAERCPACEGPTFELVTCTQCSVPLVIAEQTDMGALQRCRDNDSGDEFSQDIDPPETDAEDEESVQLTDAKSGRTCLFVAPGTQDAEFVSIDRETARVLDVARGETIKAHLFDKVSCPRCGATPTQYRPNVFQSVRLGAPFLLGNVIPQLLEAAPAADEAALPFGGRQLITFTDSRQGTARFAARLQQDAERNYVRGVLYHAVQAPSASDDEQIAKLQRNIAQLESVAATNQGLAEMLKEAREELQRLTSSSDFQIGWTETVNLLASRRETETWMADLWEARDSRYSSPVELAEMQLLREFARRPRRQNSAETMGLATLRWPAIDKLTAMSLPGPFADRSLTIGDWQDFLYVVVTYLIRANSAVAVDRDTLRWIGVPGRTRVFAGPESPSDRTQGILGWPLARRRGRYARPVYLLAHALGVDPSTAEGAARIDTCMELAWRHLQPLALPDSKGLRLSFRCSQLAPVRRAWMCPITGRVLDRVFYGLTPYVPLVAQPLPVQAQPIEMPRFPFSWGQCNGDRVSNQEIRDWLGNDEQVETARARGAWRDLHDRIALTAPYFRVAEHSAQQSSARLQRYEEKFKKREINILSCSTTMEMGVDIGGISTVVMTNVPPAPANYRQRAGRAGRRDESRAISLTFCRDNPLGWTVFKQPTWPFDHAVRPPAVSLDSPIIVQRHVNALLLSAFLKGETEATGENALKLRAGWFFGTKPRERNQAPAARFIAWCESVAGLPAEVDADLTAITAYSCLEGHLGLRGEAAAALEAAAEEWRHEWDGLIETEEQLSLQDSAARTSLRLQKARFEQEYLLGDLASRGFLPGYGFPTDIVPFVINAPDHKQSSRDDNRFSVREFPSRQLDLAIRDYAPGSEVVLDGLVYESAGVTLNWQRPAGAGDVREIQSLRYAWLCRDCGMTDTAIEMPEQCSGCGSGDIKKNPYLRPSGFAVDVRQKPHSDTALVRYVPPATPWISARGGTWVSLPGVEVGRFRATRGGHIFHYTSGVAGHGFALCLECGRAVEENAGGAQSGALPSSMRNHRPLRGARQGASTDGVCAGVDRPFAVRRHLMLGHDIRTDVFELQLFELDDETMAISLVIALRESLSRQLGVDPQELGWATVLTKGPGSRPCRALMLYDRAAGGAGFAGQATEDVPGLLRAAAEVLDCSNEECVAACHACILTSDSQFQANKLDRKAASAFLDKSVLPRLHLPPERQYLGPNSWAEPRTVVDAIDYAMQKNSGGTVTIWMGGPPDEWDLAEWSARPLLEKWGARGCEPQIVIPRSVLVTMSPEQRMGLSRLVDRSRGRLATVAKSPREGEGWRVADIVTTAGQRCWVVDEARLLTPDQNWGAPVDWPIVTGRPGNSPEVTPEDADALAKEFRRLALPVEVASEVDGPIGQFGQRFWDHISAKKPDVGGLIRGGQPIVAATYEDRYLRTPLMVRLLIEVLRPLAGGDRGGKSIALTCRTTAPNERGTSPILFQHDWRTQEIRDTVLQSALRKTGYTPSLEVKPRQMLPHDRRLVVEWRDGRRLRLGLDQGLGYWLTSRQIRFPFTAQASTQVEALLRADMAVKSPNQFSTVIYVYPLTHEDARPADGDARPLVTGE